MVYRFGPFAVDDAAFEVRRNGETVAAEPQVLAVILHLIEQRDRVVTRDDLVAAIWHGRAISDAAIASRIKSARQVLGDNGSAQSVIRTVHGRGFRFVAPVLIEDWKEENAPPAAANALPATGAANSSGSLPAHYSGDRPVRRTVLAGVLAATVASAAGVVAIWQGRVADSRVPSEVAPLVAQARKAMTQGARVAQFQAIGLLRRVVLTLPDYADGWGMLGMAYAIPSHYSERSQQLDLRNRGVDSARRATELDRGNGFAELALAMLLPFLGHNFERSRHMTRALARLPEDGDVLAFQAMVLHSEGCPKAAVSLYEKIADRPLTPAVYNDYIRALWCAGRSEVTDRALEDALALYPTNYSLWFTRFYLLLFSGRAAEASARLADRESWPMGLEDIGHQNLDRLAKAMETREPALVDAVSRHFIADARVQSYEAEQAIRILSAFGRVDDAYTLVDAYYFGRGFVIPDWQDVGDQFSPGERDTKLLFEPVTQPLRADPRFEPLMQALGLTEYWRSVGMTPDYRRV